MPQELTSTFRCYKLFSRGKMGQCRNICRRSKSFLHLQTNNPTWPLKRSSCCLELLSEFNVTQLFWMMMSNFNIFLSIPVSWILCSYGNIMNLMIYVQLPMFSGNTGSRVPYCILKMCNQRVTVGQLVGQLSKNPGVGSSTHKVSVTIIILCCMGNSECLE